MTYSPKFRGNSALGASRKTGSNYTNGSGQMLIKSRPVCINALSKIVGVNVSDQTSVQRMVGICAEDIPNTASGQVMDIGRLEDVVTSFALGDALYVGKDGFITNIKPEIGVGGFVSGDFIIFIGVVVQNEFNVGQKDIKVMLSVIGQL